MAGVLVLGIGNTLLSDDGIGVHVVNLLETHRRQAGLDARIRLRDGGTIGLSLLAELSPEVGLIAVDAMEMGAPPGTVRRFDGAAMDRQLTGTKKTAHEVALSDLMQAAVLAECAPRRRALVGIQPESTGWGLAPGAAVGGALADAAATVRRIAEEWLDG